MRDVQSSRPSTARLGTFHIVVSSVAAIAGVALAAYQVFMPQPAAQAPVNVVVSLDPQKSDSGAADMTIVKSDAPAIETTSVDLTRGARITSALKDGGEERYAIANLFDGAEDTFVAISPPDEELGIQVEFPDGEVHEVTAIDYRPPEGVDPASMAASVDVTVMPEFSVSGAGLEVFSFSLPRSAQPQSFPSPGRVRGTGVILLVKPNPAVEKSYVGDFRVLSEKVAP
ncbi:MAG: hypothetical protein ACKOED_04680 [Aestuariivirga sp.]|uniref:hypothetical protein n=1 Tax=Aestuariivirga sp. TaxID=2650926 RepID=UPI0038D16509